MHTFQVTFSRTSAVVLILVLIPLLAVAAFLAPILYFPDVPDWLVIVIIVLMMAVALGGVLLCLKKWGTIKAEASMDQNGIDIRLLQYSPFYARRQYTSHWDGLENVSTNIDPQHNRRFYLISFRNPSTTVSLMPAEAADEDTETPFGEMLLNYVQQYNTTHQSQPEAIIRQKGFYDGWWAKALTVFAYALTAIALIGFIADSEKVPFWRVIQVLSFSALWLAAYHANRRKK